MWPFRRKTGDRPVEDRLLALESDLRLIRGEWTETLDSLTRERHRIVKAAARANSLLLEAAPPAAPVARAAANGPQPDDTDEVTIRRTHRTFPGQT
jgi:hypothetical protein